MKARHASCSTVLPASMIYADKFSYYYPEGRIWGPES
jgi:hypothetical protein